MFVCVCLYFCTLSALETQSPLLSLLGRFIFMVEFFLPPDCISEDCWFASLFLRLLDRNHATSFLRGGTL